MVFPATTAELILRQPIKPILLKETRPFGEQVGVQMDRVKKMASATNQQLLNIGAKFPKIRDDALDKIRKLAYEYNIHTDTVLAALGFKSDQPKAMGNDVLTVSNTQPSDVFSEGAQIPGREEVNLKADSSVPSSGELLKIKQSEEIEKRKAWVDTANLKFEEVTERERQIRGLQLKKGISDVRLDGQEGIPAGKYFVKEALDADTDPFGDYDNPVPVESRQLLRYQRLKEAGAKVPGTLRKYMENGEGYFVITDLTFGGKNWVWGITDHWIYKGVPKEVNVGLINWDQLAGDLVMNASCATNANVLTGDDAHIISGSDGSITDYLADLDKQTLLYPEEAATFKKEDIEISNLGNAGKTLIRFIQDTGQSSKMAEYFGLFWAKTKQFYGADRTKVFSQELLENSTIAIGLEKSEVEIIKNVLIEPENSSQPH